MNRLELASELRARLISCGAEWAWLREPKIIFHDLKVGVEVDLWCDYTGFPALVAGLLSEGWVPQGGRYIGTPGKKWFSGSIILRCPKGDLPKLDIHTGDLRWRLVPLLSAHEVCRGRISQGADWYLNDRALAWIVIARPLLRGNLSKDRLQRARALWSRFPHEFREEFVLQLGELLGSNIGGGLKALLEERIESALGGRRFLLHAAVRRPAHLVEGLAVAVRRIRGQLSSGIVRCTFIGTDGSGKSTQIRFLEKRLRAIDWRVSQHYWGRTRGNVGWVKILRRLGTRMLSIGGDEFVSPDSKKFDVSHDIGLFGKSVLSMGAVIYVLDYWLRDLILRARASRREVLLFDRGAYDLAVMRGLWNWMRNIYRLAPGSDMLIFCDAPVAEIRARKQERTLGEIKFQQSVYNRIAEDRFNAGTALIIHTADAAQSSTNTVVAAIGLHACRARGVLDPKLLRVLVTALQRRLVCRN